MSAGLDAEKVAEFWRAVAATSTGFVRDMMAMAGKTSEFRHVCAALEVVHPDLLLVLGRPDAVRPEFVISAGGIRAAFGAVHEVVRAAPAEVLERYDVRGFRPRVADPSQVRVRAKGRELGAIDVRWDARRQAGDRTVCDLTVYIPGFLDALPPDSMANRAIVESVFLLLDHIAGEWAVESQIGRIKWCSAEGSLGLPTLAALPEFLDKIAAD